MEQFPKRIILIERVQYLGMVEVNHQISRVMPVLTSLRMHNFLMKVVRRQDILKNSIPKPLEMKEAICQMEENRIQGSQVHMPSGVISQLISEGTIQSFPNLQVQSQQINYQTFKDLLKQLNREKSQEKDNLKIIRRALLKWMMKMINFRMQFLTDSIKSKKKLIKCSKIKDNKDFKQPVKEVP